MSVSPFGLRMPPDLQARVKRDAAANNRSMNAEIIARLEAGDETLRDRLAMAAMPSMLTEMYAHSIRRGAHLDIFGETTKAAYEIADAMLAERSKP